MHWHEYRTSKIPQRQMADRLTSVTHNRSAGSVTRADLVEKVDEAVAGARRSEERGGDNS
jgi:hypothetical protein